MDTISEPQSEVTQEIPVNAKGMRKQLNLPGTRYFRQRRMRPLFFGWLCGLLTLISSAIAIGLIWVTNYANNYAYEYYDDFSWLYYGAVILAVIVIVLLFIFVTIGLPVLYGHVNGLKQVIKIIFHELVFLIVLLAVVLMLSIKFSDFFNQRPDPSRYYPYDCINCSEPLKAL